MIVDIIVVDYLIKITLSKQYLEDILYSNYLLLMEILKSKEDQLISDETLIDVN